MRWFRADTEAQLNFTWADFEVPNVAARVATPPLLVIHDKNDRRDAAVVASATAFVRSGGG
jgi:hypothetical protein